MEPKPWFKLPVFQNLHIFHKPPKHYGLGLGLAVLWIGFYGPCDLHAQGGAMSQEREAIYITPGPTPTQTPTPAPAPASPKTPGPQQRQFEVPKNPKTPPSAIQTDKPKVDPKKVKSLFDKANSGEKSDSPVQTHSAQGSSKEGTSTQTGNGGVKKTVKPDQGSKRNQLPPAGNSKREDSGGPVAADTAEGKSVESIAVGTDSALGQKSEVLPPTENKTSSKKPVISSGGNIPLSETMANGPNGPNVPHSAVPESEGRVTQTLDARTDAGQAISTVGGVMGGSAGAKIGKVGDVIQSKTIPEAVGKGADIVVPGSREVVEGVAAGDGDRVFQAGVDVAADQGSKLVIGIIIGLVGGGVLGSIIAYILIATGAGQAISDGIKNGFGWLADQLGLYGGADAASVAAITAELDALQAQADANVAEGESIAAEIAAKEAEQKAAEEKAAKEEEAKRKEEEGDGEDDPDEEEDDAEADEDAEADDQPPAEDSGSMDPDGHGGGRGKGGAYEEKIRDAMSKPRPSTWIRDPGDGLPGYSGPDDYLGDPSNGKGPRVTVPELTPAEDAFKNHGQTPPSGGGGEEGSDTGDTGPELDHGPEEATGEKKGKYKLGKLTTDTPQTIKDMELGVDKSIDKKN